MVARSAGFEVNLRSVPSMPGANGPLTSWA